MPKNPSTTSIEITDYTDYVSYLVDLVRQKQQAGGFSYRNFCRRSGFKSPTYLKWVIDGVRPISLKSVHKFAAGLSLKKREVQYFLLMVNYKEAIDPQTKHYYYEQMLAQQKRKWDTIRKDAYEYLRHWYYVALRELIGSPDFKNDPHWIRDRLGPDLTLWEIKNGLKTLERLKLIERNAKGQWQQTSRDLHTEYEVKSLAAYNYHTEMLELAHHTLIKRSARERDYQSLLARIDRETFAELKIKIQQFQESLVKYLQEREKSRGKTPALKELYAFNTQLFPLTTPRREGGS